jgi:hypothetical protein
LPNGTATYTYQVIAEDRQGSLTAASSAGQTTAGASTLGANNITIAAAANDSGAMAQNYAAGASLTIAVQTAAAGCTTSPADANVIVQYRMQ